MRPTHAERHEPVSEAASADRAASDSRRMRDSNPNQVISVGRTGSLQTASTRTFDPVLNHSRVLELQETPPFVRFLWGLPLVCSSPSQSCGKSLRQNPRPPRSPLTRRGDSLVASFRVPHEEDRRVRGAPEPSHAELQQRSRGSTDEEAQQERLLRIWAVNVTQDTRSPSGCGSAPSNRTSAMAAWLARRTLEVLEHGWEERGERSLLVDRARASA